MLTGSRSEGSLDSRRLALDGIGDSLGLEDCSRGEFYIHQQGSFWQVRKSSLGMSMVWVYRHLVVVVH